MNYYFRKRDEQAEFLLALFVDFEVYIEEHIKEHYTLPPQSALRFNGDTLLEAKIAVNDIIRSIKPNCIFRYRSFGDDVARLLALVGKLPYTLEIGGMYNLLVHIKHARTVSKIGPRFDDVCALIAGDSTALQYCACVCARMVDTLGSQSELARLYDNRADKVLGEFISIYGGDP